MASTARKWFIGCGIGCGFMLLAVGGVGTCGYFGVKKVQQRVERLEAGFDDLATRHGRPGEYVPPADAVVTADQVGTFLAVRRDLAPARDDLAAVLASLDGSGDGAGILAKFQAGFSLLPRMFDFIDQRNAALAEHGMGVGEYLYVYSVVYYAWLQKDPADGPAFTVAEHDAWDADEDPDVSMNFGWRGGGRDSERNRERRRAGLQRYVHKLQADWLANQRAVADGPGAPAGWTDALAFEADRQAADPRRLLWQDSLPAPDEAVLAPFRADLEASWSPMMNVVEVGLVEHD